MCFVKIVVFFCNFVHELQTKSYYLYRRRDRDRRLYKKSVFLFKRMKNKTNELFNHFHLFI